MKFGPHHFAISTRRKLISIMLSVAIFTLLAGLTNLARGRSVVFGTVNAILVGTGVGLVEEFYVQTRLGRWMRSIHPLRSIFFYTVIVVIIFIIATKPVHRSISDLFLIRLPYERLGYIVLPIFIALSVIGVVVMRTVHFIGVENLFHLMVGTYHRPVVQEKIILFLDINDSTDLAETLGAIRTKSMVGKFLFDISKPITDFGGEIYLYKGDGLIALWDWGDALCAANKILRAVSPTYSRRSSGNASRSFSGSSAWSRVSGSGSMAARSWSASRATPSDRSESTAARSTSPRAWRRCGEGSQCRVRDLRRCCGGIARS